MHDFQRAVVFNGFAGYGYGRSYFLLFHGEGLLCGGKPIVAGSIRHGNGYGMFARAEHGYASYVRFAVHEYGYRDFIVAHKLRSVVFKSDNDTLARIGEVFGQLSRDIKLFGRDLQGAFSAAAAARERVVAAYQGDGYVIGVRAEIGLPCACGSIGYGYGDFDR